MNIMCTYIVYTYCLCILPVHLHVLYFDYMLVNRLVSTFTICKSIHIFSRSSYIDFQVGEGLQHTRTHAYIYIHIYIYTSFGNSLPSSYGQWPILFEVFTDLPIKNGRAGILFVASLPFVGSCRVSWWSWRPSAGGRRLRCPTSLVI